MDAEGRFVVPSCDSCPSIEDTGLRLRLGAGEAPCRVDLSREVGAEAWVGGSSVVMCVHGEFGALDNAVNRARVDAQVVVVVRVNGDEARIGVEWHAVEQETILVAPHHGRGVALHSLLDELKELGAGQFMDRFAIFDRE